MKSKSRIKHIIFESKKRVSVHDLQLLCFLLQNKRICFLWDFFFLKSTNSSSKSTQNNSDCRKMSPSSIRIATVLLLGKNIYTILK